MSATPYDIAWTRTARKALARQPEKVAAAVIELLYGPVADNPHRLGKPLELDLAGLLSARRGDFRVLCRIDEQARRVEVVAIEHRSDAYRP